MTLARSPSNLSLGQATKVLKCFTDSGNRRQFSKSARRNRQSPSSSSGPESFAFAFDIDGVLCHGNQPLPAAREAIRTIRAIGSPYVFLTNGGGVSEDDKAASLAQRLGYHPDDDVIRRRLILSHSPFRDWSENAKNRRVLITASNPETARAVANEYGFTDAVTPADIIQNVENFYPFDRLMNITPHPHRRFSPEESRFHSILVWNDPRDWSLDIQIIHDLLVSRQGHLGTISNKNGDVSLPNKGWQQDGQPSLWISNLDLFWKTEYPVNRFGTGAFVEALKGVWSAVTDGAELKFQALGKPFGSAYGFAHKRILNHYHGTEGLDTNKLRRVYMIGDNPESDIRGANEFRPEDGTEWVPILVRTGVWKKTTAEPEPRHRPAVIVDDVLEAVVWAINKEGRTLPVNLTA
ncbi:HAD-superfamily hydrolase, subfamily IIA, CECR5 [Ophiocordyceps camponoti-floridani]|uniref:HAD-superfamily hydrolase, subfamily IIA, CECR5 n=1 Tax=Ophiocordyceps camponoti-floridani TaxID=2030778 RepID=A0A8H4VD57_9HYPO|nr:HAD-superfamily hydrolase, subfamily IIA, CECR5 [Ophiocordyceps camponoti-floridani]